MVGGVLVERKVGDVEPALISNRDKVSFCLHASSNLIGLIIGINIMVLVLTTSDFTGIFVFIFF